MTGAPGLLRGHLSYPAGPGNKLSPSSTLKSRVRKVQGASPCPLCPPTQMPPSFMPGRSFVISAELGPWNLGRGEGSHCSWSANDVPVLLPGRGSGEWGDRSESRNQKPKPKTPGSQISPRPACWLHGGPRGPLLRRRGAGHCRGLLPGTAEAWLALWLSGRDTCSLPREQAAAR